MVHNLFVSETRRGNTLLSLPPHRDLPAVAPLDNISEPVSRAGSKTPAPSPYESDPRAVTGERRRPPPAAGFPASAPAASPSASGPHLPSRFLGSAADARPVCRNPDARATAPRSAGCGHTCGTRQSGAPAAAPTSAAATLPAPRRSGRTRDARRPGHARARARRSPARGLARPARDPAGPSAGRLRREGRVGAARALRSQLGRRRARRLVRTLAP